MKGSTAMTNIQVAVFLILIIIVLSSCGSKETPQNMSEAESDEISAEIVESTEAVEGESVVPEGKELRGDYGEDSPELSGEYDEFPVFKASEILGPEVLKSEHHEVSETVQNDCVWNSFEINSDFGVYDAYNTRVLGVRVNEIAATAKLKEISAHEALVSGAADSVIDPFRSAINVATKPVETAKGVPGGMVSFFKKVYYSGERVVVIAGKSVDHAGNIVSGAEGEEGEDGDSGMDISEDVNYLVDWYLGVSGGERRLARELGVDPYTSNPELAAELKRVAKYERIGRVGLGFASIPNVPGMEYVQDINFHVWDKDPRELRSFNKQILIDMGIDEAIVEQFLNSPYYSPSFQTTLVFSLKELDEVQNREEIIEDGVVAASIPEAEVFIRMVLNLVWFHTNQAPLASIINHGDITSGMTADRRIITIIPVDYLCWSTDVEQIARFHDEVFSEIDAESRELWVTGGVSQLANDELNKLGWSVKKSVDVQLEGTTDKEDKEATMREINRGAFDILQQQEEAEGGTENAPPNP